MIQEQYGQGAVDETVPPTSRVNGENGYTFKNPPRDVTEPRHDGPIGPPARTSALDFCSGTSPPTTNTTTVVTDLEKAPDANVDAATGQPSTPYKNTTNAVPDPNPTLNAARPDGELPKCEQDYPEGGMQAWLVVFGSFTGMTAGFGLMNTVGTFQAYISTHQLAHDSPSLVGWIFSIYIFLAFFCGVQIGPVFDAKGPRWLVLAGSVALVGGTFAFAESTSTSSFPIFENSVGLASDPRAAALSPLSSFI